jgi:hypothetical protein
MNNFTKKTYTLYDKQKLHSDGNIRICVNTDLLSGYENQQLSNKVINYLTHYQRN